MDLQSTRTEFLVALIGAVESAALPRFKVYLSQSLMLKSPFTLKNLNLLEIEAKRKASVEVEERKASVEVEAPVEAQQPAAASSQPEETKS